MGRIGLLSLLVLGFGSVNAYGDGNEILGAPGIAIAPGTGVVAAGVGLNASQPANLDITIPGGVSIEQVLLYWYGRGSGDGVNGDDMITIAGNSVQGTLIGETLGLPFPPSQVYRADITGPNLVVNGANSLAIDDLDFNFNNDGAGMIVIINDGGTLSDIQLVDGHDFTAFNQGFNDPLDRTVAKTYSFAAAAIERTAQLDLFIGDGEADRADAVEVTVGAIMTRYNDVANSADGHEWDTLNFDVTIPAGETEVTVQVFSVDEPNNPLKPDSICWIASILTVPINDEECDECDGKVTELTLKYSGPMADIRIVQKKGKNGMLVYEMDDVATDTEFTIFGVDKNDTLGTDILIYVNGALHVKIHTSCSQPIGPGLIAGDFEVISGASRFGGELCLTDLPEPVCECSGKVTELTLINNGPGANIKVEQKRRHVVIFVETFVAQDEEFSFIGTERHGTMGTDINIFVNGSKHVKIHTSCSQPIGPGLIAGDFGVISGFSRNGGELCDLEPGTMQN